MVIVTLPDRATQQTCTNLVELWLATELPAPINCGCNPLPSLFWASASPLPFRLALLEVFEPRILQAMASVHSLFGRGSDRLHVGIAGCIALMVANFGDWFDFARGGIPLDVFFIRDERQGVREFHGEATFLLRRNRRP